MILPLMWMVKIMVTRENPNLKWMMTKGYRKPSFLPLFLNHITNHVFSFFLCDQSCFFSFVLCVCFSLPLTFYNWRCYINRYIMIFIYIYIHRYIPLLVLPHTYKLRIDGLNMFKLWI